MPSPRLAPLLLPCESWRRSDGSESLTAMEAERHIAHYSSGSRSQRRRPHHPRPAPGSSASDFPSDEDPPWPWPACEVCRGLQRGWSGPAACLDLLRARCRPWLNHGIGVAKPQGLERLLGVGQSSPAHPGSWWWPLVATELTGEDPGAVKNPAWTGSARSPLALRSLAPPSDVFIYGIFTPWQGDGVLWVESHTSP